MKKDEKKLIHNSKTLVPVATAFKIHNLLSVGLSCILIYLCLPVFEATFLYAAQVINDTPVSSGDSLITQTLVPVATEPLVPASTATNSLDTELNIFGHFITVIIGLAIVIILLILTVWVLKQILRFRGSVIADGSIDVLAIKYIEQKKAIAIIRVLKKVLIIGIAENSVTALGELSSEEIDNLELDKKAKPNVFSDIIKKAKKLKN